MRVWITYKTKDFNLLRVFWHAVTLIVLIFLVSGCAGMYFRKAGQPPPTDPYLNLSRFPIKEYWTGIVFNGNKIGFSRFTMSKHKTLPDRYEISSEAAFRIRFLTFDKKVNLKSYDLVAGDLTLKAFQYAYDLDDSQLKIKGRAAENRLEVEIHSTGQTKVEKIPLKEKIYPTSIIGIYPVIHGLEIGRNYTYAVYDGQTQKVGVVTQSVLAYEESDLFEGRAFKIKTRLFGQEVFSWVDVSGRPLLELSQGGIIISALENKQTAMKYLTQAAINKDENLLNFSLIKIDQPLPDPRLIEYLEVSLYGIDRDLKVVSDSRQDCNRRGAETICRIHMQALNNQDNLQGQPPVAVEPYLKSSFVVPSQNQTIRKLSSQIVGAAGSSHDQISALIEWLQKNIKQEVMDVFTALDVLENRKAECQGHSYLYAAFARALNIPTRVVNGIVYSQDYQGFLFHTWAESYVNGSWVAVDPTFYQVPADATHIKLVEGEQISDLLPLVPLIGKIKVRIRAVDLQ